MLDLGQFCAASGLRMGDLVLGVSPSSKHKVLMSDYLLHLWRGPEAVRDTILVDFRSALNAGMLERAADLSQVLRQFIDDFPEVSLNDEIFIFQH